MIDIPIEFMPGFWVSLPEGIEGKGSGFLLAENIKSVFSVNFNVPKSQDFQRSWSIISMTENELDKPGYMDAFTRIIVESWLESMSIIVIGTEDSIKKILVGFLSRIGNINIEHTHKIIKSKLG
jgi:hypothetical protein